MIQTLTPLERLGNVEARVYELGEALTEIQSTQDRIIENNKKLFEIHDHNEKYLKEIHTMFTEWKESKDG